MDERIDRYTRLIRLAYAFFVWLLVLALYPGTMNPAGDIKNVLIGAAALGFVSAWLAGVWFLGAPVRRPRFFLPLLLAFLAVYFVAFLRSSYTGVSAVEMTRFFSLFALYWVATQVYTNEAQLRGLMLAICGAVAVASLYGFCQRLGLDPFPWENRESPLYRNLPATFGNPNFAAHALILAIIMALYLAVTGTRAAWIFLPIFAAHLLATHQRAGLVALAAAAALVLVARYVGRRVKVPQAAVIVSVVLVVFLGLVAAGGAMGVAKLRTGSALPLDGSLLLRYQSYTSAARMALDAPLGGHGPGVYRIENPRYWTPYEQEWFALERRMNMHVHSDALELAVDAGIPATGLYLALLIAGVLLGLALALSAEARSRRRALGFAFSALFLAFMVDGLFGFNLRVPVSAGLLFLLFGSLDGLLAKAVPDAAGKGTGRAKALGAALLAATAACALFAACVFAAQVNLKSAAAANETGDLLAAEAALRSGERLAPWNWEFSRRLGRLSLRQRDYEESIAHFDRSLEINPYFIMTQLLLARTKHLIALKSMETHPDDIDTCLSLLDESVGHVEAMLGYCPMLPEGQDMLSSLSVVSAMRLAQDTSAGGADKRDAYWRRAEEHLLQAIHYRAPNQSELFKRLGDVRMATARAGEAGQAYVRAVTVEADDVSAWPDFFTFALSQKRQDEFKNVVEGRIQSYASKTAPDPKVLSALHMWRAAIMEAGYKDVNEATRSFKKAADTAPHAVEVWINFGRYADRNDQLDALSKAFLKVCDAPAGESESLPPSLAAVCAVVTAGDGALVQPLKQLLQTLRGPVPKRGLSRSEGFAWATLLAYNRVAYANPDTPGVCDARIELGIMLSMTNLLEKANTVFKLAGACARGPKLGIVAMHWADVLVRQKRYDHAIQLLVKACERLPQAIDIHLALARVYVAVGQPEKAHERIQDLLELEGISDAVKERLQSELDKL